MYFEGGFKAFIHGVFLICISQVSQIFKKKYNHTQPVINQPRLFPPNASGTDSPYTALSNHDE